jgi:hypothetical protein
MHVLSDVSRDFTSGDVVGARVKMGKVYKNTPQAATVCLPHCSPVVDNRYGIASYQHRVLHRSILYIPLDTTFSWFLR